MDGLAPLARHHQLHGVQPVLPVPDVQAAADWFCRTLGFSIDFLHGAPAVHGRVRLGDRSWGDPVFIHLSHSPGAVLPCGETWLHVGTTSTACTPTCRRRAPLCCRRRSTNPGACANASSRRPAGTGCGFAPKFGSRGRAPHDSPRGAAGLIGPSSPLGALGPLGRSA